MKKIIVPLLFLLAFLVPANTFAQNSDFRLKAEILIEDTAHQYKSVRLVPEIYNSSAKSLGDLRVIDEAGEAVPYFINRYDKEQKIIYKEFSAPKINEYVKDDYYYFDFGVEGIEENTDIIANTISLKLAEKRDYFAELEILGSYDNISWQPVASDSIFRIEDINKEEIHLPFSFKFTFYRIKILNTLDKIHISDIILQFDQKTYDESYYTNTMDVPFVIFDNKEERTTEISLQQQSLKNLKIQSITLMTDAMFKRRVTYGPYSDTLYNLDFENNRLTDTSIKLEGRYFDENDKIVIFNHDDKPLTIQSVQVEYGVDDVIFKSEAGKQYYIAVGNDSLERPVYDIELYKDNILLEGFDTAKLGTVLLTEEKEEVPKEINFFQRNQRMILNMTVSAAGIILTIIVLISLKKSTNK